ncbi:TraR/DksA family transcriptional regulator [Rhizobium subbaraonis]|uniref:TraR/DksA family transcriptional regulator n=1 Tax=Rhizobium subbaraonis TaxID=908946 RepID=A0A285UI58_9HYPH|nr:TraR/DksA C4-type zinc finger protein [Rhizobium subbaraonis]SOC41595.1 TraR/DksA family transcriptional regulator [Rhizobium subbaraonis]
MNIGNFARELGEERLERERDVAIARARSALKQPGADDCEDCERPIREARRRAMPSATRCISCQEAAESRGRRVA